MQYSLSEYRDRLSFDKLSATAPASMQSRTNGQRAIAKKTTNVSVRGELVEP